jgi:hypothetical protein
MGPLPHSNYHPVEKATFFIVISKQLPKSRAELAMPLYTGKEVRASTVANRANKKKSRLKENVITAFHHSSLDLYNLFRVNQRWWKDMDMRILVLVTLE